MLKYYLDKFRTSCKKRKIKTQTLRLRMRNAACVCGRKLKANNLLIDSSLLHITVTTVRGKGVQAGVPHPAPTRNLQNIKDKLADQKRAPSRQYKVVQI
jgi:hypothetical protein